MGFGLGRCRGGGGDDSWNAGSDGDEVGLRWPNGQAEECVGRSAGCR